MEVERAAPLASRRGLLAALVCAAALLGLTLMAAIPGQAAGATNHCVHANNGGTGTCTYGGLNTYAASFPGTSYTIWRGSFYNAATGTNKAINRISYCCTGEWYSSSVLAWDQNMPGRTTDAIVFYNWHTNPVNVSAWWRHT